MNKYVVDYFYVWVDEKVSLFPYLLKKIIPISLCLTFQKKKKKNPIIFVIILYKPNFTWSISQANGFGPLWVLPNASWTNKSGIALNLQGVRWISYLSLLTCNHLLHMEKQLRCIMMSIPSRIHAAITYLGGMQVRKPEQDYAWCQVTSCSKSFILCFGSRKLDEILCWELLNRWNK